MLRLLCFWGLGGVKVGGPRERSGEALGGALALAEVDPFNSPLRVGEAVGGTGVMAHLEELRLRAVETEGEERALGAVPVKP